MKQPMFLASLACACLGFTLTACGGGSSSSTPTPSVQTPPTPPTPPPSTNSGTVTLEGTVSKGLFFGAEVAVFSSADVLADDSKVLASISSDPNDGSYSLTLDTDNVQDFGEYLIVGAAINGAEILCDSPTGCLDRADFGERFSVLPADPTSPELFMFSIFPTPDINSTSRVNLNIFSTLHFNFMDSQLSARPVFEFDSSVIDSAAERVSTIFELPNSDFHSYEFVDLTQDVDSSNIDHIRASLISGGLQSLMSKFRNIAATPDRIGFEWGLFDLSDSFIRLNGEIRANVDYEFELSLLNIYEDAGLFETLDIRGNNAYGSALQSVKDSYAAVLASDRFSDTVNGELVPPGPNEAPEFFNETSLIQFNEGNTGSVNQYPYDLNATAFDPDGDILTFSINSGADAAAFEITEDMFLAPLQPFLCSRPDDVDENHRYEVTVNYSDGEFSGTQDLDIRVYADNGDFCPGFTSKSSAAQKSKQGLSTETSTRESSFGKLGKTLRTAF